MYELPGDDAPMVEWTRPVSALMITRRISFFSDDNGAAERGAQSGLARRINKTRRKRAAKINMTMFWRLHDLSMGIAEMAETLGVSTRTVERARAMRRRDV